MTRHAQQLFKLKRSKVKVTKSRDVSADKNVITRQCMVISTSNLVEIIDVGVDACGIISRSKDRLRSKEQRERLGVDDIALTLQQNRLRWYGHVLQKDDDDWVKKCMEYEVEGLRPRGRPKRTWKEVVREDCQARKLNKEDAVDCCKWRKVIKEVR